MRFIALLLWLLIACCSLGSASKPEFVASKLRKPFHVLSCEWASRIAEESRVYFSTRQAALDAGHRPCKVCNP